jgi:hypothetical protein
LRHVVQPYVNASFVYSGEEPTDILQFDRLNRSTQLPPIDFPQFTTIDSSTTGASSASASEIGSRRAGIITR